MTEMVEIGFKKVILDYDIMNRVYDEKDFALWGTTPIFMVCGQK